MIEIRELWVQTSQGPGCNVTASGPPLFVDAAARGSVNGPHPPHSPAETAHSYAELASPMPTSASHFAPAHQSHAPAHQLSAHIHQPSCRAPPASRLRPPAPRTRPRPPAPRTRPPASHACSTSPHAVPCQPHPCGPPRPHPPAPRMRCARPTPASASPTHARTPPALRTRSRPPATCMRPVRRQPHSRARQLHAPLRLPSRRARLPSLICISQGAPGSFALPGCYVRARGHAGGRVRLAYVAGNASVPPVHAQLRAVWLRFLAGQHRAVQLLSFDPEDETPNF
ncbi:hypothetical protein FIBSPDRAFT_890792 [Athelia psychrophila]|uniref:Uncharacterized protein n=1 Tax=Athelia psychrophila TaxID=1759441 RepID=A0A166KK98_9AGAM|nr:hypothetical protein FIBSPDRAFT_890792 [Fibularhizoctonia sp. CBS 109695]